MIFYIVLAYFFFVWLKVDYDLKHGLKHLKALTLRNINELFGENSSFMGYNLNAEAVNEVACFFFIIISPIFYWVIIVIKIIGLLGLFKNKENENE